MMNYRTTHRVSTPRKLRDRLGYRDVVPAREAVRRATRWLVENPPSAGGYEETALQDPFDYAAEDRLAPGGARRPRPRPTSATTSLPGYGIAYAGPGDPRPPRRPHPQDVIDAPAHRGLALEAARQLVVLLKNDGLLPLDPARGGRLAVIGTTPNVLFEDWYSGTLPYSVTPLAGITELHSGQTAFVEGVDLVSLRAEDGRFLAASADGQVGLVEQWDEPWVRLRPVRVGSGRGDPARCRLRPVPRLDRGRRSRH